MNLVVLADTHVTKDLAERLPSQVLEAIRGADAVLHAGDIIGKEALAELRAMNATYAVLGNNDRDLTRDLPESLVICFEDVRIAMVHNAGDKTGREQRMHGRFPDADVVVFGHSHKPCNELGVNGQLLFNPGSPTQRRAEPNHSFGRLVLQAGVISSHTIEIV